MPGTAKDRPERPWVPDSVKVGPVTKVMSVARATKITPARSKPVWELTWRVDGERYKRRFPKAGDAEVFAEDLRRGHHAQLSFDPGSGRFLSPLAALVGTTVEVETPAPSAMTVFAWTEIYWAWKWPSLEPKPRAELARYLNRVRAWFTTSKAPRHLEPAVTRFLERSSLVVAGGGLPEDERIGQSWVAEHSMPMEAIGRLELEAFVGHYRTNQRYPDREVSVTTQRRMLADLKQCWARAVHEEIIESNPWDKIELRARSSKRSATGRSALTADAELVLSPEQIWELADVCVEQGSWDGSVRAFVLVMGFCGLRPNETVGLVIGDLELPDRGAGWVTVRRTRRNVPDRYLEPGEDAEWGPLKGRELADTRRVPIPGRVVEALRAHLEKYRSTATADALVFARYGKPFDLSVFGDDVWGPARAHLFPPNRSMPPESPLQPKLSRLRRHDLRHSACSMWLRARVDVAVCQRWSGHRRLSVFLDVYQGLIPGREEEGVELLLTSLGE